MADWSGEEVTWKSEKGVKTPRFYIDVANILRDIETRHTSVKSAVLNAKLKSKGARGVYGIVCKILKHKAVLEYIIAESPLAVETIVNQYVLKVVVYELIVRKRQINGKTRPVLMALKHRAALEVALDQYLKWHGYECIEDLEASTDEAMLEIPRYVRVNTLVTTLDAVIEWLCNEGFREAYYYQSDGDYVHEKFIERVKRLRRYEFMKDLQVENLLIFHSKQSFYNHNLYNGGSIILQDKASCFPVLCLKPRPGKLVIDACAAPGMKTTLIASLMNNKGCIFALDRSSYRVETMVDILRVTNVTCADVRVTDFLNINPQELPYRKVRYILLDPSCSCSGIVSERQRAGEDAYDVSIERLKALATFQLALLKHALSFPKVKRVVYSTCSIYETENEDVIMEALKEFDDRFFFPEVKVGWPALEGATGDYSSLNGHCLKTIPARDLTNGFFVAVFHRRKKMSGEEK